MRDMTNLNHEQAKANGWEIIKPCDFEVVAKAVYQDEDGNKIMKSTKRFSVIGGWIYNTSTEYHKGNQISVAEALVFVPMPEPIPACKQE